jgi:3-methyladenine DNA glycosylase AlkD
LCWYWSKPALILKKSKISVTNHFSVRKEVKRLVDFVTGHKRPEEVPFIKRYIRTRYEMLGVRKPVLHSIAKGIHAEHKKDDDLREIHRLVHDLWRLPIYDVKTLAISILRQFGKRLDRSTFELVKNWYDDVDNWSHCDGLSVYVLGSIILNDDSVIGEIMAWTKSDNFWRRRAALTSTMIGNRKAKVDPFWTFTMLNDLVDDDEHYVKKAFSWVLREMGKGYPDFVFEYLMYNKSKFKKMDVKESVKYLPKEKARMVLESDLS